MHLHLLDKRALIVKPWHNRHNIWKLIVLKSSEMIINAIFSIFVYETTIHLINLQYIDKVRMQNSFINKWHIIIMNIIHVICRQR